jgi:glycosyltransferase involved in cell wall biosynthesis
MNVVCEHLFENFLPIRQAYLHNLLEGLDRAGVTNKVWSYKSSNLPLFSRPEMHIFRNESRLKQSYLRLGSRLNGYESYLTQYLLRDSSSTHCEVVHAHFLWMSKTAQEIKQRKGTPILLSSYGEDELFLARNHQEVAEAVVSKLVDFDMILTPSQYLLGLLRDLIGEDSRLVLWHIGIDSNKLSHISHPSKRGFRVLCVSRLIDRKGLRYLIQAIPYVLKVDPSIKFRVVGEGPEQGALLNLAKKLDVSGALELLPYQESLFEVYSDADIFVLPSIVMPDGVTEGLGVPLLEAEASGLPIVATGVGGIPEAVEDGKQGFLVEAADPKALADRILQLASDAELRKQMGLSGRIKVRNEFNVDVQARKLSKLYNEIV